MKVSVLSFQNFRDYMEDFYFVDETFLNKSILAGVYDGHGGLNVSKYASKSIHDHFKDYLVDIEPLEAFNLSYKRIDEEVKEHKGGSCAINCFINDDIIYHANVGDGKAIVIGEDIITLTTEHKLTDLGEQKRILEKGGIIRGHYVFVDYAGLKVTRSLGDIPHKKIGVISDPSTGKYKISNKDKYLLIGSDGLFDYISNKKIKEVCSGQENNILENLKNEAISQGSGDNITILLIKLK